MRVDLKCSSHKKAMATMCHDGGVGYRYGGVHFYMLSNQHITQLKLTRYYVSRVISMKLEKKNLNQQYGVGGKAPYTESEDFILSSRCHLSSLPLMSFNVLQPHRHLSLITQFLGGSEKKICGNVLYAP